MSDKETLDALKNLSVGGGKPGAMSKLNLAGQQQ
jgi:hypothetical protein